MTDLLMPKLGLTMTEGTLVEWRAAPGVPFAAGEIVFVVENEKVATEIMAEAAGCFDEVLVPEGETVAVGTVLARQTRDDEPTAGGAGQSKTGRPQRAGAAVAARQDASERFVATPLARRLAAKEGIALAGVAGSGPGGRIKAADVRQAIVGQAGPSRRSPTVGRPPSLPSYGMRTAERVSRAKREIPHFYVSSQAAIGKLEDFRQQYNAIGRGPKLTVTHTLARAIGLALQSRPEVNVVWTDAGSIGISETDVGLVVATPKGLRVPVLREAGTRPLEAVSREAARLVEKARTGDLSAADMGGGAISLSNLGMYGVASVTPIIYPPQAMILGVGAGQSLFRPDAHGQPALCLELTLTLAADHRVIDGVAAAEFLGEVVACLERPLKLLLGGTCGGAHKGEQ